MRSALLAVTVALAACGGSSVHDAPVDAGSVDAAASLPPCAAPIVGDAPFGVVVSGSGPVTKVGSYASDKVTTVEAAATLYFPRGRVAGAEVVIAGAGLHYATLDASLSARIVSSASCSGGFSGTLLGPNDGVEATATVITTGASDAVGTVSGPVKLCRSGVPPPQRLWDIPTHVPAVESFSVTGTRPFARETLASVRANPPVPLEVTATLQGVRVAPTAGRFPLFAPTVIDLSGLRDVLGEPLGLTSVTTIVPTEPVADLSFTTPASRASYVGAVSFDRGMLQLGGGRGVTAAAVALGGAGRTKLRVRHQLYCEGTRPGKWNVSIVSSDGNTTPLALSCGADIVEEVVPLTGSGPFMLHAVANTNVIQPCWYGIDDDSSTYLLDEIAFE